MVEAIGEIDYKKLRKELSLGRGLERYIGVDFYSSKHLGKRGAWPFIFGDWPTWGLRPKELEGNMLFSANDHTVVEINPETKAVVWQFGEFMVSGSDLAHLKNPNGVDYDPVNDRLLITDSGNNRILLVDRKTKSVLKSVTQAVGYGPFNDPRKAFFNPWNDYNSFTVADSCNHIVYELDFDGNVLHKFGTRGTAGVGMSPEQTNLNLPTCAFPYLNQVLVADFNNNRVFTSDWTTIAGVTGYPAGPHLIPVLNPYQLVGNRQGTWMLACTPHQQLFMYGPDQPIWWWELSINADWANFDDYEPDMMMFEHWFTMWHVNWRIMSPRTIPKTTTFFDSLSLAANATSIEYPLHCYGYDKVTIYAISDQAATVDILVARPAVLQAFREWQIYDSVSLTANKLTVYPTSGPSMIMAIRITMGATAGTVNAWASLMKET